MILTWSRFQSHSSMFGGFTPYSLGDCRRRSRPTRPSAAARSWTVRGRRSNRRSGAVAGMPVALTIASVSGSLPCIGTYRTLGIEALADPSRRAIFELLGAGPQSVVAIAGSVPISRPAVSQHLKVLKDAGLVTVQAVGTRRIYALDPAGVGAARDYFDQFWTTALAAYTQTANTIKEEQ